MPPTTHHDAAAPPELVTVPPSSASQLERLGGRLGVAAAPPLVAALESQRQPCGHCGGSGMLRISVQSHRTCMDCLGGGQRLLTSGDLLRRVGFRAVGSASA